MELKKDYLCLEKNSRVLCKNIELDFDYQEAIPAYLDDVYRVLSCRVRSYITSADISFNEIKLFGKVIISLTYFNENSGLCYADYEEEFNKSITAENLSEAAFLCVDICDKYSSYKIINQRRIDIHASAVIHIDVYDKVKTPCLKACEGAKLRYEKVKTAYVYAFDISKIDFDEEFSVPTDSPSIKRIISYNAFAFLNDYKIIKDKMLLKATVNLEVLYSADTDSEELLNTQYVFNVSKIVEISGVNDKDIVIPEIKVGSVFLKAKNNSGDRLDVISAYGEILTYSRIIRENEKELICDMYIPKANSDCEYNDYISISDGGIIQENRQLNLLFKSNSEISQIKELIVDITNSSLKNSKFSVELKLSGITVNPSGELSSLSSEETAELDFGDFNGLFAALSINSYDYSISDANTIRLRLNLKLTAYRYNENNIKLISDITAEDIQKERPGITVYFASESENIWDIAKCFSSDTELIKKENALSSDVLDTNKVLIIPKA